MSTKPVADPTPPPRRLRKLVGIPAVVLALMALGLLWAVVRGTWADYTPRNPTTAAQGVLAQLYQGPDGRKRVRCAALLDHPLERAWAVVTDYGHFAEIFPHLATTSATREADGRYRLTGVATSPVGSWEFTTHVRHEESADRCAASWDEPGGRLTVNRGSWALTRAGPGAALVVYELELEVAPYPTFLVRDVLLSQLPAVVAAVGRRLEATARAQP